MREFKNILVVQTAFIGKHLVKMHAVGMEDILL